MKKKAKNTESRKPLGHGEHIRVRPIYCGKGACKSCPHMFYAYKVWREGNRVREKYLWKCNEAGRRVPRANASRKPLATPRANKKDAPASAPLQQEQLFSLRPGMKLSPSLVATTGSKAARRVRISNLYTFLLGEGLTHGKASSAEGRQRQHF